MPPALKYLFRVVKAMVRPTGLSAEAREQTKG